MGKERVGDRMLRRTYKVKRVCQIGKSNQYEAEGITKFIRYLLHLSSQYPPLGYGAKVSLEM